MAWILALQDLMIRLPVYLTSCSSMPSASRSAISDCSSTAASALTCASVRKPLANARRAQARLRAACSFWIWQMPTFWRTKAMSCGSTPDSYSRSAMLSASRLYFACSTQALACTYRSCCNGEGIAKQRGIELANDVAGLDFASLGKDRDDRQRRGGRRWHRTLVRKRRTKGNVRLDDVFKTPYQRPAQAG